MDEARDIEFQILDLQFELQKKAKETKIPTPLQHYLNGETVEAGLEQFRQDLETIKSGDAVERLKGDIEFEEQRADIRGKVEDSVFKPEEARRQEAADRAKATSEESLEFVKQSQEAAEKRLQAALEAYKKNEEVLQNIRDQRKKDIQDKVKRGLMTQQEADVINAQTDAIASSGLHMLYEGTDGSVVTMADENGNPIGYAYVNPETAEAITKTDDLLMVGKSLADKIKAQSYGLPTYKQFEKGLGAGSGKSEIDIDIYPRKPGE